MNPDTLWKIAAVCVYGLVLVFIGVLASRRMKNIRDYYAADKKLGFWSAAFSARATGESAWLLLGLTGTGFFVGAQGFWIVLGEVLGVAAAWLFMAGRFKNLSDRYGALTVPDYLEARFRDTGHGLRLVAAFALVVFVPIYAGSQVFATGQAFNSFLGWNHFLGAAVGFAVVILYITKGGFLSVVWSDVFQGSLMLLGLVVLPLIGLMELGGYTNLMGTLRESFPGHLTATNGEGWSPLKVTQVIGFAAIGIGFMGSPQVFVRFIALRGKGEIKKGAAVAIVWTILADSGAVLVGIVGRAIFTDADLGFSASGVVLKDNILPVMSNTLLPSFFAGVFIAMVLSAIMSTVDSLLVVASSAAVRDYWQKTKNPEMSDESLVKTSQRLTLVLALIAFALGMGILAYDREQGVFWVIIFGWSGIAATFCPTIILSLVWSGMTALAAKAAMVAGFLAVPFLKFGAPPLFEAVGWADGTEYLEGLDVLFPAFVISGCVGVVVGLLDRAGREALAGEGISDELRDRV